MKNKYSLKILKLAFLLCPFLYGLQASGQSTNPAPYCYPTAVSMVQGTCTYSYGFNLQSVKVNTLLQTGSCYGTGNTDVYRYWNSTTTLDAGNTYTMEIVTPQSSYNFSVSTGFWIDYDQDSTFDSTELVNVGIVKNNITGGVKHVYSFTVPCNAKAGATRMRVRSQGLNIIKGVHACSAVSNYGESWDFQITIAQPSIANAGFAGPDTVFVKTKVNFVNSYRIAFDNAWDANNDGSIDASAKDFSYTWTSGGNKCVKLVSTNCVGKDSITKCLYVKSPTAIPNPDFRTCTRVVEQYETIQVFDETTNGPYQWHWNVYDSTNGLYPSIYTGEVVADPNGNGNNEFSKNPEFQFLLPGTYGITLVAKNDVGPSKSVRKAFYITVIPPTNYTLGFGAYGPKSDNSVRSNYGSIYDNGGPNLNYSNNQGISTKSYLSIVPEKQAPVTMKFHELKFADTNDYINIYDDDTINPSMLIARLSVAQNGTTPSFTSTGNSMFFIFSSNGIGNDKGYHATYSVDGYGPGARPLDLQHKVTLSQLLLYNKYRNLDYLNGYNRWKLDNVYQAAFNGSDTFRFAFTDTSTHSFCLEHSTCDTTITLCKNLRFDVGIMGSTYFDANNNCTRDISDKAMNNVLLKLYDSSSNLLGQHTSMGGDYNFNTGKGNHTIVIDTSSIPFLASCNYPGIDSTVALTNNNPVANIDFNIRCKPGFDVGVQSVVPRGRIFPGTLHVLAVMAGDLSQWYDLKCASNRSGSVKISVTGPVTYFGKFTNTLTPSVSGKVFTYTVSDFGNIKNGSDFGLYLRTDTSAQSGDTVTVVVVVTPTSGDNDTTNNKKVFRYIVGNSYDPNMKEVYPVDVPPLYNDWFTYTIHFQNTGTAAAHNIRLADTLSSKLDLSTFRVLNYSHTMSATLLGNALSFRFPNIMLPDSFTDKEGSQGFVQYSIRPKKNLPEGTKINNTAFIYFDYNAPVVTNTTVNEYVKETTSINPVKYSGFVNIYPNPNNGVFKVGLPGSLKGLPVTVEVYNAMGVLVHSASTANAAAQLDMNTQASGVYFVRVKGADMVLNACFVKQ